MIYIVVNIGCIECDVSTEVIGAFYEKSEADALAAKQLDWREGGQSEAQVFELPEIQGTD